MPIVNAHTVSTARVASQIAQAGTREPVPAWARPQVAWPFLVSKPLAAQASSRPSVPSFSS